jgi:hypothetical protein
MKCKSRVVSTRLSTREEALVRGAALSSQVSLAELLRESAVEGARRRMATLAGSQPDDWKPAA